MLKNNDFLQYHKTRLAQEEPKLKDWSDNMKQSFKDVDQAREKMLILTTLLEEHLRNKWSDELPDAEYRKQAGYIRESKIVKKIKLLEEELYKCLYKVRSF